MRAAARPLHVVEGVTLNGRPLAFPPERCGICNRKHQSRPGWSLYESDVECARSVA